MKCPNCEYPRMIIIDTRYVQGVPKRRRECPKCEVRSTTYEISVDDIGAKEGIGLIEARETARHIVG